MLATVAGAPWLVRSGNVVLLGSRLEPEWTELPVSAGFMPFMDCLLNRLARGEVTLAEGAPGDAGPAARSVTACGRVSASGRWRVADGSARPTPGCTSSWPRRDTVGAISANLDPRESLLGSGDR